MSPRTDSYMSLCLEQAALSPLHYRHGAIIVSGGKIIGQGYNHYRPGFDGGALKTGQIASGGFCDGEAIAALKLKKKQKSKKPDQEQQQRSPLLSSPSSTTSSSEKSFFIPFETTHLQGNSSPTNGGGGGYRVNTPLSMHSEMMAIHSALSLSSAISSPGSARSAKLLEKPCFKLPGRGKQRLRLQGLKSYVEAVCGEQTAIINSLAAANACGANVHGARLRVQQSRFEGAAYQFDGSERGPGRQGGVQRGVQRREREWEEREREGGGSERGGEERRAVIGGAGCGVLPGSGAGADSSSGSDSWSRSSSSSGGSRDSPHPTCRPSGFTTTTTPTTA